MSFGPPHPLINFVLGWALRLGQARGPSAAARIGQGAGRCGHKINYIHVLLMKSCTKVKECPKTVLKEFTLKLWDTLGYSGFWSKNKNSIFTIWWTLNHYDLETNMLSPRCHGNASTRKRFNAEMPQKPVLRNFRSFWEIPQNWKGISEYFWGVS